MMSKVSLHLHTLRERLRAELQGFSTSVLQSLLTPPDISYCSCRQPGHCRIVFLKITADDGSPFLEPTFQDCTCLPVWHNHHQRQLDLIKADLKNAEDQVSQLGTLQKGLQVLLVRHREISKAELKGEQYWLRQDYARTDTVRKLTNHDLQKKAERLARAANQTKRTEGGKVVEGEKVEFLEVDQDDLWIDLEDYGYLPCLLDNSTSEETSDGKTVEIHRKKAIATPASREYSGMVKSEGAIDIKDSAEDQAAVSIRLGHVISIEEIFERFDDLRSR